MEEKDTAGFLLTGLLYHHTFLFTGLGNNLWNSLRKCCIILFIISSLVDAIFQLLNNSAEKINIYLALHLFIALITFF